jgi:hypothetical protein
VRAHVGRGQAGPNGLGYLQHDGLEGRGDERRSRLGRRADECHRHGVRARIAALDLGTVIGVCVRVWRMPGGYVQVVGHAVLVLVVIMPRERVDVPRHRRPAGQQHGRGHESGEQALHAQECTGSEGARQSEANQETWQDTVDVSGPHPCHADTSASESVTDGAAGGRASATEGIARRTCPRRHIV